MSKPLTPDYSSGVDRRELKQLRQRFLDLSRLRLERILAECNDQQASFLHALPLLFHVNHPLLPGFISRTTPAGVTNYAVDKTIIAQVKRLIRGYAGSTGEQASKPDLIGLYAMGSPGTLAQSQSSDIDLWLVYRKGLSPGAVQALTDKARAVSAAAAETGLELHVFPMNAADFRKASQHARPSGQRSADSEDSGSAQHFVLLDEFYRTCIYLAGAWPLWWLIPPDREQAYEATARLLAEKRFIRSRDYVDFGSCPTIPSNELVGAGLWQLYKSIDSPYKSLLKLSLMEVYARTPDQASLSLRFKAAVYAGDHSAEELDPYLMLLRFLESSFQQLGMEDRVELLRKCFYLKSGVRLSAPRIANGAWKYHLLEAVTAQWNWSVSTVEYLDAAGVWKTHASIREQKALVQALSASYRLLSSLARSGGGQAAISARDVHLLGRKLYARFQRKAGKIDLVAVGAESDLAELSLSFEHVISSQRWTVRDPAGRLLRESDALVELLTWCHVNGQLQKHTALRMPRSAQTSRSSHDIGEAPVVSAEDHGGSGGEAAEENRLAAVAITDVRLILQTLRSSIPFTAASLPPVQQSAYLKPAVVTAAALFINVGSDVEEALSVRGLQRISDRSDPLSYSQDRICLVSTVDLLTINSWNEISVQRFERGDTLLQCLRFLLGASDCPVPEVICLGRNRPQLIARRVADLCQQLFGTIWDRLVLQYGQRLCLLERDSGSILVLPNAEAVIAALGRNREREDGAVDRGFRSLALDSETLPGHELRCLAALNAPHAIQLCLEAVSRQASARFWIFDASGSLIHGSLQRRSSDSGAADERAETGLLIFLRNTLERLQMSADLDSDDVVTAINCFRLMAAPTLESPQPERRAGRSGFQAKPTAISAQIPHQLMSLVSVIGHYFPGPETSDCISLNGQLICFEFRYDGRVFKPGDVVAIARELSGQAFAIVDLSLPADTAGTSTAHSLGDYVNCRQALEAQIRAAMQRV